MKPIITRITTNTLSLITCCIILGLAVNVVSQPMGKQSIKSKAAAPVTASKLFKITSVDMMQQEIGPNLPNHTDSVNVCGTDLGLMFKHENNLYAVFGDTFGCPLSSNPPSWRHNSMAKINVPSADNLPTINNWISQSGQAKELFPPDSGIMSAIPTSGISANSSIYLSYMHINNWGVEDGNQWKCTNSSFAKSTDGGQNWSKLSNLLWLPGSFNQLANYKFGEYIYFFGTPCGRYGNVKLMRVRESQIEFKNDYEYYTGTNSISKPKFDKNESLAIPIVSGPVGELSVAWNKYLKQYIMMYLKPINSTSGQIVMRTSSMIWGPWSSPMTVVDSSSYPCLYAPYVHDDYQSADGKTVFFRMSRFCPGFSPYSTYIMKMTLQNSEPYITPVNL